MNDDLIQILIENDNSSCTVCQGTSLQQILSQSGLSQKDEYIAAFVNNRAKDISSRIFSSKSVRFISINSTEGERIYERSAQFIMEKAIFDIDKTIRVRALHSVGRGIYFEFVEKGENISDYDNFIYEIKKRVANLIERDIPIVRCSIEYSKALELCQRYNIYDKRILYETRPSFFISCYNLDGYIGDFHGVMVPSTGFIKVWDIKPFDEGFVLMLPSKEDSTQLEKLIESPKIYNVFREYKQWTKVLNIANIGDLNDLIIKGHAKELIMVGESLHEKRISRIADIIYQRKSKIILIAGPSSSGKTTFSKRLAVHLAIMGYMPIPISMDDYFVNRELSPRNPDGSYNFESLQSVDTKLFEQNIQSLLAGETVELPHYNFITGKREYLGNNICLKENSLLIIEGIHTLNPSILTSIDKKYIFKIFASALTAISIDFESIIHTTDNRLLRRIVRDYQTRGQSAYDTLKRWDSVREGEKSNIFPYQELADEMFNTALIYELAVIAAKAEPLLRNVPVNVPEYANALRLLKFLTYFIEIPSETIPPTSIIREFIGGSAFKY